MAVGKQNKKLTKKGKGLKKRLVDPFLKKDWYDVRAPATFEIRQIGKTLVSRTQGTKIASDGLKGRVYEVSLADLRKGEDNANRKIRLRCEEVQGTTCLTNFYGMDFTRDRLSFLIRKKQDLIEAHADVKTTDGYVLRVFCIGFTMRDKTQRDNPNATAYAQTAMIKQIRKKMVDIIVAQCTSCDLKELVRNFLVESEVFGKAIKRACRDIYHLQDVYIRKVKVLRSPKFDLTKLMELHGGADVPMEDVGEEVERPQEPIPGTEGDIEEAAEIPGN